MLFTGPELPIKGIAAGNPHWQLQTKKRMEERNQGRRIPAQLPRIKIPLVSQNSNQKLRDKTKIGHFLPKSLGKRRPLRVLSKLMNSGLIIPDSSEPSVRTLRATVPENEGHGFRSFGATLKLLYHRFLYTVCARLGVTTDKGGSPL